MNGTHDSLPDRAVAELPPLNARFYVPKLADKPQNPILDTLKVLGGLDAPPVQPALLLRREAADPAVDRPLFGSFHAGEKMNLWRKVCDKGLLHRVRSF